MHHRRRSHDLTTEHLADALVAEADAENRPFPGEALDHGIAHPGVLGTARAGRYQHGVRIE